MPQSDQNQGMPREPLCLVTSPAGEITLFMDLTRAELFQVYDEDGNCIGLTSVKPDAPRQDAA